MATVKFLKDYSTRKEGEVKEIKDKSLLQYLIKNGIVEETNQPVAPTEPVVNAELTIDETESKTETPTADIKVTSPEEVAEITAKTDDLLVETIKTSYESAKGLFSEDEQLEVEILLEKATKEDLQKASELIKIKIDNQNEN